MKLRENAAINQAVNDKRIGEMSEKDFGVSETPTYADAIRRRNSSLQRAKKVYDELEKDAEEVTPEKDSTKKVKTPQLKAMRLSESKRTEEEDDIWTKIYDELSSDIDPQDARRELRPKKGQRYQAINTTYEGDIEVLAPTKERLEFAEEVANHYGADYKILEIPFSKNDYNKFKIVIHVRDNDIANSLKVISSFSDYTPWGDAREVFGRVSSEGKLGQLEELLVKQYPQGVRVSDINAFLSKNKDFIFEMLHID